MSVEVITLGTGNPIPDPNRAGPATLVKAAGANLLFDCGRGVLMRAMAAGVMAPGITGLFLTHLHSDHTTDLGDVITTRWVISPDPSPLPIYGPPGTAKLVERVLASLEDDIGWRIAHHESLSEPPRVVVVEIAEGVVLELPGLHIAAAPTEHKPVHPTIGFRIEATETDPASAAERTVVVCIAGDTIPCAGLDALCAGADAYVQTVVRESLVRMIPFPRLQDVLDYHSSLEQAGETATKAGAKLLVLTHPVPGVAPGTEQDWVDEAALTFNGEIVLAHDLWSRAL